MGNKAENIDEAIDSLESICEKLSNSWPAQHGHRVMHALKKLSGKMIPHGVSDIPHRINFSIHNSYAPWANESHLTPFFEDVKPQFYSKSESSKSTLVDIYRFWSIYEALFSLRHVKGDAIEVGTYRGGTAALIGHTLQHLGSNDHLYICDTFTGVVKATGRDTAYVGGEHSDTTVDIVESLVSKYRDRNKFSILKGIFPEETGDKLKSDVIKFCHVDVDVYQSAKDVFEYIWPKMIYGGIVMFDDYATQGLEGMTRACNEIKQYPDCRTFNMFNGQLMAIKI